MSGGIGADLLDLISEEEKLKLAKRAMSAGARKAAEEIAHKLFAEATASQRIMRVLDAEIAKRLAEHVKGQFGYTHSRTMTAVHRYVDEVTAQVLDRDYVVEVTVRRKAEGES